MKKEIRAWLVFFAVFCYSCMPAAAYSPDAALRSEAYLMTHLESGMAVCGQNADKRMYPASTTKIMTFIVTAEQVTDLENTRFSAPQGLFAELEENGSSMAGIPYGRQLSVKELLYCLMLPSGNDAALLLAVSIGGSEAGFAELMNQKAAQLGCLDTHFVNPHGYHNENHYTTARDLSVMAEYALRLPLFAEIVSSAEYEIPASDGFPAMELENSNLLLQSDSQMFYPYCRGIKTGTTTPAGFCFVSTAEKEGVCYLLVTLGAPRNQAANGAFSDAVTLYEWAFSSLQQVTAAAPDTAIAVANIKGAFWRDTLPLYPDRELAAVIPAGAAPGDITLSTELPKEIDAPVYAGQIAGKATFSYQGEALGEVNLIAGEDVRKSHMPMFISLFFLLVSVATLGVYLKKHGSRQNV